MYVKYIYKKEKEEIKKEDDKTKKGIEGRPMGSDEHLFSIYFFSEKKRRKKDGKDIEKTRHGVAF